MRHGSSTICTAVAIERMIEISFAMGFLDLLMEESDADVNS